MKTRFILVSDRHALIKQNTQPVQETYRTIAASGGIGRTWNFRDRFTGGRLSF